MILYRVKTRSFSAYVIAENMDNAAEKLVKWLNDNDYGFSSDRQLVSVDVVADSNVCSLPDHITNHQERLFL